MVFSRTTGPKRVERAWPLPNSACEDGTIGKDATPDDLRVLTGVDLVKLDEFQDSLERGGDAFRQRLFHPSEVAGATVERLAGIFAVKEAAYKALALPKGNWHVIEVSHDAEGRPSLAFAPEFDASHLASWDVTISHTGGFVVAVVVALAR